MFANKYIKKLKPYPLTSHRAWELVGATDVLKLDWNESTITPSPKVKENIKAFLESGHVNWYPDVNNIELLNKLAGYSEVPLSNVQYFAGSDSLHEYIVRTFIEPEDDVLIVSPTYDNFRAVVESNGAESKFYNLEDGFTLDWNAFEKFVSMHCPKIIYICNPNNPTGTLHSKADIEKMVVSFPETLFIIDEAYYEFTGITCKDLVLEHDNVIISRTFSKGFGLASFRIGYALSSPGNIQLLSKVRNPKNISTFSQISALAVLDDLPYMQAYVEKVNLAKKIFNAAMEDLGVTVFDEGGNFSLIKLECSIKEKLIVFLEKNHVFVRDYGHIKGMENYVRITVGTQGQMERVAKEVARFFSNEKNSIL